MILVLVNDNYDTPSYRVIDWLEYLSADYHILNGMDFANGDYSIYKYIGNKGDYGIDTEKIKVVWSRRWYSSPFFSIPIDNVSLKQKVNRNLQSEYATLCNYFFFYELRNAYWIPDRKVVNVNKLTVLEEAKRIGFSIPNTLITNNKKELLNFQKTFSNKIICKPIDNLDFYVFNKGRSIFTTYTTIVSNKLIDSLPERFFPSLFQQYINKLLEYRVFFFEGKIYATAIIPTSQLQMVDSRAGYNDLIRYEPADLDSKIVEQIRVLMTSLGLNTGSLDFILSDEGTLYFLEVNPVGQFSGYSDYCSYGLERKVAEFLIKKNNE